MKFNDPARRGGEAVRPGAGRHRSRTWALLVAICVAAVAISACGSSSTSSSTPSSNSASTGAGTAASTSASSSGGASAGVAHADAIVKQYANPLSSYNLPTKPVSGVAAEKGKTVMYIPLIQAIPAFAITAGSLKSALAAVGMNEQVCNGQANPTGVASCVSQAISSGDVGIITDAIPFQMASTAFTNAEAHKVPVLITDQFPDPSTVKANLLAYQPGNVNQAQLIADWIISDSKGKANAIVGMESDSPSSVAYVQQLMKPEFQKYCPACKVDIVHLTGSTPAQIASTVNSALLSNPSAQYYYGEFEDDLQGTLQGLQQAGKINSIKTEFATATIAGLTKLKAGQAVYAEIGDDVNYEGWADADAMLRMLAKQPIVSENTPERIFTRQNIGSIKLTNAAQASGEWYGNPSGFESGFKKLWGAG